MVGPPPGGRPPSPPNLKDTGGIRHFTVALQDAAAGFFPFISFLQGPDNVTGVDGLT
jgi:hypothetical protein